MVPANNALYCPQRNTIFFDDVFAGAFTKQGARDGNLEKGDLEEAFFGLAAAGDPTPQYTGNRRIDRRIATRAAMLGHGIREQRLANFNTGYNGGAEECLPGIGLSN